MSFFGIPDLASFVDTFSGKTNVSSSRKFYFGTSVTTTLLNFAPLLRRVIFIG